MSAAPVVVFEALTASERWLEVGRLYEADSPGSISGHDDDGTRQVWLFGWHEGQVGVYLSVAGADVENPDVRLVASLALERLSDLTEPYELTYRTPAEQHRTVRWSLLRGSAEPEAQT